MPRISYDAFAAWSNHHLTIGRSTPTDPFPYLTIESLGKVHAADVTDPSGLRRFAETGTALLAHVEKLDDALRKKPASAPPFAAGIVGRAWSFAPLIGTPRSQLICEGLAGTGELAPVERHTACPVPVDRIALTNGGTRLRELLVWAKRRNLSIATSGTHLGPTVAGAFGTASHGSRLDCGGLQNLVLGMHLIVGPDEHVWLEPARAPVLSDEGIAVLAIGTATLRVIRDDDRFDDALIHLGGMGIVNGVALSLVPDTAYALMKRQRTIDRDWLETLDRGDFADIAARLGCKTTPIFYELTLNPHQPLVDAAAHIMYFPTKAVSLLPAGDAKIVRPADAIGQVATLPFGNLVASHTLAGADPEIDLALCYLFGGEDSIFSFYRQLGEFDASTDPFDPDGPGIDHYRWAELHGDQITGDLPGALYNASFAIPRDLVSTAIPAICAAVSALPATFVFTLRFVSNPAGTLAFTRFSENAVIEIDGLSPLICRLQSANVEPTQHNAAAISRGIAALVDTLPRGARAVRKGLDQAGIQYSMHWAKLGDLDRAKVLADFGDPATAGSAIYRWRYTRDAILPPASRRLFWNEALINYGVLDRPS